MANTYLLEVTLYYLLVPSVLVQYCCTKSGVEASTWWCSTPHRVRAVLESFDSTNLQMVHGCIL